MLKEDKKDKEKETEEESLWAQLEGIFDGSPKNRD
jgi:hypothetical protein